MYMCKISDKGYAIRIIFFYCQDILKFSNSKSNIKMINVKRDNFELISYIQKSFISDNYESHVSFFKTRVLHL